MERAASSREPRRQRSRVTGIFDTPVIVDEVPDSGALNDALRTVILDRQRKSEGVSISNVGGWHSDTGMVDWGGEQARALCQRIVELADAYTIDLKAKDGPRHRWAAEMWANVSGSGASNRHHCHPGAYWSAVYYVDDGYAGSSDRSLGGELVLFDPRMPMVRMTAPDLRFRGPGDSPDHDEVFLRPAAGRIVMFPSWLNHAVLQYNGSGTRISIAVNLTPVALPPANTGTDQPSTSSDTSR